MLGVWGMPLKITYFAIDFGSNLWKKQLSFYSTETTYIYTLQQYCMHVVISTLKCSSFAIVLYSYVAIGLSM